MDRSFDDRPVRVGFSLVTLIPGRPGGSETYVRGLLSRFSAMSRPMHIAVLANRELVEAYGHFGKGSVTIHRLGGFLTGRSRPVRAAGLLSAQMFPAVAARDMPKSLDVIHYPLTVAAPASSLPRVVTIHDTLHHDLPDQLGRIQGRYRRYLYDGAARSATMVVTPSRHSRDRLVQLLALEPSKIEVIPHGLDVERFTAKVGDTDGALDTLSLPERFLLYPAAFFPHKNHIRLLEAFGRIGDKSLGLVLTGQHWGRWAKIREHARRLRVADRVVYLGFLPERLLPALYRRAQALVFPSLYEGFGWPPLEAMACGCPVVSSTRASLAEVCNEAALPLDPEDVESIAANMERIVGDEPLRQQLRRKGAEHAARFNWTKCTERHIEVYRRATSMGRPASSR